MKLYEITFSFDEPCNAIGTFSAESEEAARKKLFDVAGDTVKNLEIISIVFKGEIDDQSTITAPATGAPANQLLN